MSGYGYFLPAGFAKTAGLTISTLYSSLDPSEIHKDSWYGPPTLTGFGR